MNVCNDKSISMCGILCYVNNPSVILDIIQLRKIKLMVPSKEEHLMKNVIAFIASTLQIKLKCDSSAVLQEQEGILKQT